MIDPASASGLIARLERIPFSRWHLRARIIMGSATFFDAFDALSLAFVLPVLVRLWGMSASQIGWLIAAGYFGQFAGALLFGTLAERYGRIRSAAGATALMSVMSLACALAGNFPALLALRLVQGIGVGGEMPVAAVYINELSKAQGRGRFFMLYEMIFPVGLMVTGQIGALVVPVFGWQVMFLIGGIPGLVISGLLLRLRESPRWLIGKGRLPEAEAIIREIEGSLAGHLQVSGVAGHGLTPRQAGRKDPPYGDQATAHDVNNRTRWAELLSPFYRRRTVVVWTLWASAYFITNGLNNWMPTLYNRVYGLSLDQSLRAGTLNNVAQVAILLGCAFTIDRIGRRRWATVCFTAGAAVLAMLGFFASGSVTAVMLLVTLSYGIVGSVNAVLYLYTPEIYPTRMRAIGTGAATCWLRLASAAGPLLVGYLVAEGGTGAVFLMFAAAGVVGALASTLMLETRNQRLEDLAP
ncbi:MAG: major facilitator superfamily 1 [Acidobacteria bacterium]|nr:major facilitator superfamily 1 [Acidobacteriota bacterium]